MDSNLPTIPPILPPKVPKRKPKPVQATFELGEEFFDELLFRLVERRKKNRPLYRKITKPRFGWFKHTGDDELRFTNLSKEILGNIIKTAFWASLEQDEGRRIRFSLVYRCSTEVGPQTDGTVFDSDIIFDSPKLFNIDALAELSPAIGQNSCVLLTSAKKEQLQISGISLHGYGDFKVTVLDPGHLIVKYNDENVALVSGAQVVFFRAGLYVHTYQVWEHLFPSKEGDLASFSDPRTKVIINTLREMRNEAHGGALVVVPVKERDSDKGIEHIAYRSSAEFHYGRRIIEEVKQRAAEDSNYLGFETTYFAEELAKLTAVDGATIVTDDLDLIGFGVMFKARSQTKRPPIYMLDPLDHKNWFKSIELEQLGHARHRSAAQFILSRRKAVAFVVSQDGHVTAIRWNSEKKDLRVISRLELTLF